MRSAITHLILSGVLLAGMTGRVQAIATADNTISAQNPTNQGYSLSWDNVYNYKNSSSVAVDHYWILTAAHVGDDGATGNLNINGETYSQQEVVFHPTADLALVRYDKPFSGYYPLHAGEIHNGKNGPMRVWDPLLLSGYGYSGSVTATTFSQSGSTGTKRWGTNRGVSESLVNADIGGGVIKSTQCFRVNFNLADTSYEAGANTFDSGGPVFIEQGGGWKLTGILLYRPTTSENRAAMIHDYIAWIKSVIVDYDTDMDGLPDWWEDAHGASPTAMDASGHSDSDDFTNYEEWLADTDPTDGNSFLQLGAYTNAESLVFSSSSNRKYQVQYRLNLTDTNEMWATELDWFDGSALQTEKSVSQPTSNRFFRIRAKLP